MNKDFKLFVWEDVLTDYTSGLVCVYARTEKEAWDELFKKDSTAFMVLNGLEWSMPEIKEMKIEYKDTKDLSELGRLWLEKHNEPCFKNARKPKIITEPEAFIST